jgi:hypothetical protein
MARERPAGSQPPVLETSLSLIGLSTSPPSASRTRSEVRRAHGRLRPRPSRDVPCAISLVDRAALAPASRASSSSPCPSWMAYRDLSLSTAGATRATRTRPRRESLCRAARLYTALESPRGSAGHCPEGTVDVLRRTASLKTALPRVAPSDLRTTARRGRANVRLQGR